MGFAADAKAHATAAGLVDTFVVAGAPEYLRAADSECSTLATRQDAGLPGGQRTVPPLANARRRLDR
jgi:hypothetical protein